MFNRKYLLLFTSVCCITVILNIKVYMYKEQTMQKKIALVSTKQQNETLNERKHQRWSNSEQLHQLPDQNKHFHHDQTDKDKNRKSRKTQTSQELGYLVQQRIHYIQNPKDCKSAMKLVCDLTHKQGGFGCLSHHVVACLILAYTTNRTLILEKNGWNYAKEGWEVFFQPLSKTCTSTYGQKAISWKTSRVTNRTPVAKLPIFFQLNKFFPFAIPDDLADRIASVHADPGLWWIGQFATYLTRPNNELQQWLDAKEEEVGFKKPVVGIHVRRTDKINTEALKHTLEEYMHHVIKWFNNVENKTHGVNRTVYLASDDETVLTEAIKKYPNFTFISNIASQFKLHAKRYSKDSLRGIVTDAVFLSRCDYVVCTHSSNICRLVYERMQPMHNDATTLVKSLDYMYVYADRRFLKAVDNHTAHRKGSTHDQHTKRRTPGELNFQIGDLLTVVQNFKQTSKDGFVHGINERTRAAGLIPISKTVPFLNRVKMPTYPEVSME